MKVEIIPATFRDLSFIAANLREQDERELSCQWKDWHPANVAYVAHVSTPPDWQWVATLKGQPVAAFGCAQFSATDPDIWQAWGFGTDKMRRAIPAMTRHILGECRPRLLASSVRRLQVLTTTTHDLSHAWLSALGASYEGTLRAWGRNGEDFDIYAWVR